MIYGGNFTVKYSTFCFKKCVCVFCQIAVSLSDCSAMLIHVFVFSAVENQSHCDFVKLRNMLIRSHMHDLKDVTCDVHYENYRAQCIQEMTRLVVCVCVLMDSYLRFSLLNTFFISYIFFVFFYNLSKHWLLASIINGIHRIDIHS